MCPPLLRAHRTPINAPVGDAPLGVPSLAPTAPITITGPPARADTQIRPYKRPHRRISSIFVDFSTSAPPIIKLDKVF